MAPSPAVTTVAIVFEPTFKGIAAEAAPEIMVSPFTFIVAAGSLVVGVTVTEVIELPTFAV